MTEEAEEKKIKRTDPWISPYFLIGVCFINQPLAVALFSDGAGVAEGAWLSGV